MCFGVSDKLLASLLRAALLNNSARLASSVLGFPFKSISADALELVIVSASERQSDTEQCFVEERHCQNPKEFSVNSFLSKFTY